MSPRGTAPRAASSVGPAVAGSLAAVFTGGIVHLLIPAIVGGAFSLFASVLTIFDPLHATSRVGAIWSVYEMVLLVHAAHTVLTGLAVAGALSLLTASVRSRWAYLMGPVASLLLHAVATAVMAALALLVLDPAPHPSTWVISALVSIFAAPVVGLTTLWAIRRSDVATRGT